jgi:hypothetical protein
MQDVFTSTELRRFQDRLIAEPRLFERLTNAANPDVFVARVVALAAEYGEVISPTVVYDALRDARRGWLERETI